MIAVDSNILVHAHRADSPWHEPAHARITELAEGGVPWAIPWPCIHEFLAVVTHPRIYRPSTPADRAIMQIRGWLQSPFLALHAESDRHLETLGRLLGAARITGAAVHDARVAAICVDHGVREFWTADRDFSRFKDLRVVNPLVARA